MTPRPDLRAELEQAAAGAFTVDELLARPDAEATFQRVVGAVDVSSPADVELVVTLTALAVLRSRAAHELQIAKEIA